MCVTRNTSSRLRLDQIFPGSIIDAPLPPSETVPDASPPGGIDANPKFQKVKDSAADMRVKLRKLGKLPGIQEWWMWKKDALTIRVSAEGRSGEGVPPSARSDAPSTGEMAQEGRHRRAGAGRNGGGGNGQRRHGRVTRFRAFATVAPLLLAIPNPTSD